MQSNAQNSGWDISPTLAAAACDSATRTVHGDRDLRDMVSSQPLQLGQYTVEGGPEARGELKAILDQG